MPRTSTNPRTESIRLSMDPETKTRLQKYADQKRRSVSQLIIDWIWSVQVERDTETNTEVEKK